MAINSRYQDGFLAHLDASQRGEITFIPNGLERVGDVYNLLPSRYTLISGATGAGKLQPLTEPVLTSTGWKLMGEIVKGSYVLCPVTGKSIEVLKTFPQDNLDIYKISFDDGTFTECCNDHLWKIQTKKDVSKSASRVVDVNYMLKNGIVNKHNHSKYWIPLTNAVEFKHSTPILNPYLLGLLLGDGYLSSKYAVTLTSHSDIAEEVFNTILPLIPEDVTIKLDRQYGNVKARKITFSASIRKYLKVLGLLDKKSRVKFIPKRCLFTSIDNRVALLQGLMDTDGTCQAFKSKKKVRYSTMSVLLKDDIIELIRSLGGKASANSETREKYKDGECWTISLRIPFNPFYRSEKKDKFDSNPYREHFTKAIRSIEFLRKDTGQCILVDSLDHLYMTRDYTVTHNTSFADYSYILYPWSFIQDNKEEVDIYWEVNYFSLERKQMFKHAKWVSWLIYRDNPDILLSADQIMGFKNGPLNSKGYNLVRSYDDEMTGLLDHINMHDGKVSSKVVSRIIRQRALALGDYFYSDDIGIFVNNNPVYSYTFDEDGEVEDTKTGPRKYVNLTFKDSKFKLYQDDHRYFPHHIRSFVFFMIDGINLLGDKDVIDDISMELANARDRFGFSPVIVTQQNRAMGDISRMKLHGNDLSPQLEDIFKSSQMGFDADIIIGLFDPYRYKAFDKEGLYGGYCIKPMEGHEPSTRTPGGLNRFRSAHILKNTFGADGGVFGLKFLGECNHFETLPKLDEEDKLLKEYAKIRTGV